MLATFAAVGVLSVNMAAVGAQPAPSYDATCQGATISYSWADVRVNEVQVYGVLAGGGTGALPGVHWGGEGALAKRSGSGTLDISDFLVGFDHYRVDFFLFKKGSSDQLHAVEPITCTA